MGDVACVTTLSGMPAHSPEETHALLEAALNAHDADAFVAVYEPGATLVAPPAGDVVHGRDEIRRSLEPTFAANPRASIEVVRKLQSDGLALTHAHWRISGTDLELEGHGSIVSRRQPDGTWLIVLDNPVSPH